MFFKNEKLDFAIWVYNKNEEECRICKIKIQIIYKHARIIVYSYQSNIPIRMYFLYRYKVSEFQKDSHQ